MDFTDDQLERYSRHIILREMGGVGQQLLMDARLLIVGVGGLGAPLIQYLAAAGIGHLTLVDGDHVDLSNLQRQTLFRTNDIGRLKVDCAADFVAAINPDVGVAIHAQPIDAGTVDALVRAHDVVLDGTDRFDIRLMVSDAAVRAGKPLVSGALGPTEGQVAVFDPNSAPDAPCYRCFLPAPPGEDHQRTCSDAGVIGALAGVIGSMQALEAIKLISGMGEPLMGKLLIFDALDGRARTVRIQRNHDCPSCGALARNGAV